MTIKHVSGKETGKIMLYTLSTCGWCKKTKNLLNDLGVQYDYADIDLLGDNERDNILDEMQKWNPVGSVPTIVLNNNKSIIGFKENEIRDALAVKR